VVEPVENNLLYPLLRGRDVQRWKAEASAFIIVPHKLGMRLTAIPERDMQEQYPKAHAYLKKFEKVLRARASRGVSDMIKKGAPFYTMFAVGDYTFAPWKVVWREQASCMTASVVGSVEGKVIIPDHKLMLVNVESKEEAHYLCALLNCCFVRMGVLSYAVSIQMDTHILENIRIPKFNPNDKTHKRLAELSEQAHEAATEDNSVTLGKIEAEIDTEATKVWNLTEPELAEIQRSLKELTA
jgi:hypothetical protein